MAIKVIVQVRAPADPALVEALARIGLAARRVIGDTIIGTAEEAAIEALRAHPRVVAVDAGVKLKPLA